MRSVAEGTTDPRPSISVVIASFSGEERLLRCLESLAPQAEFAEVVVASSLDAATLGRIAARNPRIRFVQAPRRADVFALRTLGIHGTRGAFVALTEDHVTVSPRWVEALLEAHRAGHGIVGGPVDNGLRDRAYDWALYFCEYGIHMPPSPEGPVGILSGINVGYDRELLMRCREAWSREFRENEVHHALYELAGLGFHLAPDAWVESHLGMTFRHAMSHLFAGGRQYARYRKARSAPAVRVLWVAASPLVPLVLFARIVRRVASRQPARLCDLLRGLPYLSCLLASWSLGEGVGYAWNGARPPQTESATRG